MSVRIDENTDHKKYTDDMEAIDSDIMDRVIAEMNSYDADIYTAKDVKEALRQKLVLLIILKPYYHQRHCRFWKKSHRKHRKRQENILKLCSDLYSVIYCKLLAKIIVFTVDLIATTRSNAQLNAEEIEKEMQAIAETGLEEVLILTEKVQTNQVLSISEKHVRSRRNILN